MTVSNERLTFDDLRSANEARQAHWGGTDNWTLADWSNAVAGEVGEACNVVKKIRRTELGTTGNKKPTDAYYDQLETEIGDALIYLDLLAAKAGLTLDGCVSRAFNEKSAELNMPVRLLARSPDGVREALPIREAVADAIKAASGLSPLWGSDVALKSADAAIAAYLSAISSENVLRCNICGFVVDGRFKAEKPTVDFTTRGRGKPKPALSDPVSTTEGYIAENDQYVGPFRQCECGNDKLALRGVFWCCTECGLSYGEHAAPHPPKGAGE